MKILVDMNLSPRWVDLLSAHGVEAVHWARVGAANAPDEAIMAYARLHGYTILTHDLDFSALLAILGGKQPSVIQFRGGSINPDDNAGLVSRLLRAFSADIEQGAIVTVDERKVRVHILPL